MILTREQIIVEAQKRGGICALIDADQTWDARYALRCGIDFDRLIVASSTQTKTALEILEILARSGLFHVIALDSVNSLYSDHGSNISQVNPENEGSYSQLTKTLRNINLAIRKNGTTILITKLLPERGSGFITIWLLTHLDWRS